ncbi:MAG: hypothetical protein JNL66_06595 [Alphaproteobacteria bacterium]|nr:hypothetical protein [Alphaproteobacteria bacterium]
MTAFADERLTAYHEAGHVVMCVIHRVFPLSATIERQFDGATEFLGLVRHTVATRAVRRRHRRSRRAAIDVALAGMVAERRFHRHDRAESGWILDCTRALELASQGWSGRWRADRRVARRLARVDRQFADARVWQAVEIVAATLLRERTLSERDMLETCRAVVALVHGRKAARRIWDWPGYAALAYFAYDDRIGPERHAARARHCLARAAIIVGALALGVARTIVLR